MVNWLFLYSYEGGTALLMIDGWMDSALAFTHGRWMDGLVWQMVHWGPDY